ncbi:TonB-dependent receptor [Flavihumibacter sp. R14]|nr:TonB-dependent receptor [Flavihumibacter soli]
MRNKIFIAVALLLSCLTLQAQDRKISIPVNKDGDDESKSRLSGVLTDQKNNRVPFASIGLSHDGLFVLGVMSDEQGHFVLSYEFKDQIKYALKVSSVGYKPLLLKFVYPDTAVLKHIELIADQNTLNTVSITAARPLVERKTDRYIVNVEGSMLANGNTGLEVLQKSPGIWVSNDGSIKIKGNQSVMVMINDVVQRMSETDLAEYLRTLRSEDISKIEIISSPPSEFEAAGSGGIVHILLKKNRQDGIVGSVFTQYRQQVKRPAYNGGLSLNYKSKGLLLYANISAGKEESDYIANTEIIYPDQGHYASATNRYNDNSRLMYRLGATYDLSKNQFLSLQSMQTLNKLDQYFNTNITVFDDRQPLTGSARSEWFRKPQSSSSTINYALKLDSLGSGLKIIGDYTYSKKTELNNFVSVYSDAEKNSIYRNNTPNITNLYSLQADFTKILSNKWEFKSGLKFAAPERDNEVINENYISENWVRNSGLSNRFIYQEHLSMVYASLGKDIHKLSVKFGLRAEETRMEGNSVTGNEKFKRKYFSLFPSLFLRQHLNEAKGSSVFFNYARRLQRPSFGDLNPYRLKFDDYLTQLGNPNLLPEYTHKLELGTVFMKGFSADLYYEVTTDKIAQLGSPMADNSIEYQTRNFNNSNGYGISLNAPIKITSWWSTNNSLALYNLSYVINDFRIRQSSLYSRSQHSVIVRNAFNFDTAIDYRSPYVNANRHVAEQFTTDIGFSKRLYQKQVLLRLVVSDIFNTAREKDYTEYTDTRIDFYQKRPTRTVGLYFSYNFRSGKKFSEKRIELSNEEEKRRIEN